jgi:hypothetical protein
MKTSPKGTSFPGPSGFALSSFRLPVTLVASATLIGAKARDDHLPNLSRCPAQRGVRVQRPRKGDPQQDHLDLPGHLGRRPIAADLAASLRKSEDLRQQAAANLKPFLELGADRRAGRVGGINRAQQGGVFFRLAREVSGHFAEHRQYGSFPGALEGALDRGDAFSTQRGQHVLFCPEIVEEGSLANVGGFGNILDRRLQEAAFCEKLERGEEKALADLGAMALAAAGPQRA